MACRDPPCGRARPYSRPMDTTDTPAGELRPTLDGLRTAWQRNRPDARQRLDDLARLRDAFKAGREPMLTAISAAFGQRSAHETLPSDAMKARYRQSDVQDKSVTVREDS